MNLTVSEVRTFYMNLTEKSTKVGIPRGAQKRGLTKRGTKEGAYQEGHNGGLIKTNGLLFYF